MSLLRLYCFPSTSYFSTEQNQQQFHVAPFLSLYKPQQNQHKDNHISLSSSLFHVHTFPVKSKKVSPFVFHFSAITQDPVVDSSSLNVSDETANSEQEEEEYSKTRLIAQNVPWTSTHEDIRALFEKHGTVLDVEVFILLFILCF